MENIAPDVFRQRLLIEGFYTVDMDGEVVKTFLLGLANTLDLRTYGDPIVFSPSSGMGKEENAGYDAFVPLIDSGISAYVWTKQKFFSVVLYTCKGFAKEQAIEFVERFLSTEKSTVHLDF